MMIVAYHNKKVVYAYRGKYNCNMDSDWTGGILLDPMKCVDHWKRGGQDGMKSTLTPFVQHTSAPMYLSLHSHLHFALKYTPVQITAIV